MKRFKKVLSLILAAALAASLAGCGSSDILHYASVGASVVTGGDAVDENSQPLPSLNELIDKTLSYVQDSASEKIQELADTTLDHLQTEITDRLNDMIKELIGNAETEVSSAIGELSAGLADQVVNSVADALGLGDISGMIDENEDENSTAAEEAGTSADSSSVTDNTDSGSAKNTEDKNSTTAKSTDDKNSTAAKSTVDQNATASEDKTTSTTSKSKQPSVTETPAEEDAAASDTDDEEESTAADDTDEEEESTAADDTDDKEESSAAAAATEAASEPKIVNENLPEYYHYDLSTFTDLCDEFVDAAEDKDEDAVVKLYNSLIDELTNMVTLYEVAYLNYSIDVTDEYYLSEQTYCESLVNDAQDAFYIACSEVYESDCSDVFIAAADESVLKTCIEYEPRTEEERELLEQETDLVSEYEAACTDLSDCTYEYNGYVYSYDDLIDDDSILLTLAIFNYEDYLEIYEGILKAISEKLGPIYLELVKVRLQLAEYYGYDDYSEYCYENAYGRTYTTEEAQEYCDVIKDALGTNSDYNNKIAPYVYYGSYVTTTVSYENMLKELKSAVKDYGDIYTDAFEELSDKTLYNFGYDDNRYQGSFTTKLYTAGIPYIFAGIEENADGYSTITHEFGHFVNYAYEISQGNNSIFNADNYDICEIHSNGLQMLLANKFGDFLSADDAAIMLKYVASAEMGQIVSGCLYDEFQRYVYQHPDMTLDEMTEYFGKLSAEYGLTDSGQKYFWVMVPHTYSSPLYYISYSISALSAMEIWLESEDDEEKAVETLTTVVEQPDDMEYEDVMDAAGLTSFTDEKGVRELINNLIETLTAE